MGLCIAKKFANKFVELHAVEGSRWRTKPIDRIGKRRRRRNTLVVGELSCTWSIQYSNRHQVLIRKLLHMPTRGAYKSKQHALMMCVQQVKIVGEELTSFRSKKSDFMYPLWIVYPRRPRQLLLRWLGPLG